MRLSNADIQVMIKNNPSILIKYPELQASSKKQTKYRNKKVYVYSNGLVMYGEKNDNLGKPTQIFDSIKEYNRYLELVLLEKAHIIKGLRRQHSLIIQEECMYQGKKVKKIEYKADFLYIRDGKVIVEDVKPFDVNTGQFRTTKDFNLKWKMLKMKYSDFLFELF